MHHEKPNVIADSLRHRQHNTELEGLTIQMWRAQLAILSNTLFFNALNIKKAHSYRHTFTPGQVWLPEQKSALILSHKQTFPTSREREAGQQSSAVHRRTHSHIHAHAYTLSLPWILLLLPVLLFHICLLSFSILTLNHAGLQVSVSLQHTQKHLES